MSARDVILLSALVTVMTLGLIRGLRQVYDRFILGIPAERPSEVLRQMQKEMPHVAYAATAWADPVRTAQAARVGLCSRPTCAKPISPNMAKVGYLCASCAGIDAPPWIPKG